jgi:quercetin dioxygenase-like cupin family protein
MDRKPPGAEDKPWGWNLCLGTDRDRSADGFNLRAIMRRVLAGIRAGGYSSIHRHDWQSNAFHLLEGRLLVSTYAESLGLPILDERFELRAGDSVVISPRRLHKFLALTDCRLVEVYVAVAGHEAKAEDIIRFTDNGVDESLILQHV